MQPIAYQVIIPSTNRPLPYLYRKSPNTKHPYRQSGNSLKTIYLLHIPMCASHSIPSFFETPHKTLKVAILALFQLLPAPPLLLWRVALSSVVFVIYIDRHIGCYGFLQETENKCTHPCNPSHTLTILDCLICTLHYHFQ